MTKLPRSDRNLLIGAAVLVLVLTAAAALFEGREDLGSNFFPSSYSAASGGAKAAYLLLDRLGYQVERWGSSPAELPNPGTGYVLILAQPFGFAQADEKRALEAFVQSGGRVLIADSSPQGFFSRTEAVAVELPTVAWTECDPSAVSPLTRGGNIKLAKTARWKSLHADEVAQYACEKDAVVVSRVLGHGEIIWWASATPLTNAGLREGGNLNLLLASLGEPAKNHVLWDEYFHGDRPGLWSYTAGTPLKWLGVQFALLALAVLLTHSRRSGPLRAYPATSRMTSLEFVETLGALYERRKAANIAVQINYERFQALTRKRLGIQNELSAEELASAIELVFGYREPALRSDLRNAQSAVFDHELHPDDALLIAQRLHDHLVALELAPRTESLNKVNP